MGTLSMGEEPVPSASELPLTHIDLFLNPLTPTFHGEPGGSF